ncbi:hypothetical protein PTSG_08559 [Salpingoeca rosetta]|uniref:EF-hand domain-containing protein n=1 Tax=Salpingoeca rosetta (strain ATCC 50818 / BSB-021) TaxID=946362 RepID=F2UK15_SALR5|nr:uncharacterized protein PTSG_08559 [Salpingoeca rosetta]EGD77464.1 hypothetical protein PTSG_08559 [Salpingoeca rosetta]|eukprot:XP_004990352.1 hypothetical protein PTSG_08559 [Salpingoeca rosetta]
MPKKKGKGKKKGKKGKKSASSADPLLLRMQQIIDDTASRKRDESLLSVEWLEPCREWFKENVARVFDELRGVDKIGSGSVSVEEAVDVFTQFGHSKDNMETLAIAMDLQDNGSVDYCAQPKINKCYGGGLLELVDTGLERILVGQRQELADIDAEHIREKDLLKSLGVKSYRLYKKTGEMPQAPAAPAVPAETGDGGGGEDDDLDLDLDDDLDAADDGDEGDEGDDDGGDDGGDGGDDDEGGDD